MKYGMAARARRSAVLIGVATAVAALLAAGGSAGTRATAAPTLYFMYSMNCTFSVVDDSGRPVTSIAPGNYQVDVRTPIQFGTLPLPAGAGPTDMTACRGVPQFQLTGPGVNLFTTMTAGCEMDKVFPETFQPSATYVAQDLNQPSVAHATFTTLANGAPTPATVTYGGGKGKGQLGSDIVGSLAVLGTLNASVDLKGKPVLMEKGKLVSTVPTGRYRFTVKNLDPKRSFKLLGPTSKAPTALEKAVTIRLTTGRWTYYTNLGTVHYFRVTAS